MSKAILIALGVFAAVAIAVFGLMQGIKFTNITQSETDINQTNPADQSSTSSTNQERIEISAEEYTFAPSTLSIKKGVPTTITFRNNGQASHSLLVPELGVSTNVISPGEETSVEVIAGKVGQFGFYCGVGNHQDLGMEGKITVE